MGQANSPGSQLPRQVSIEPRRPGLQAKGMRRVKLSHVPLRPPNPLAGWEVKVHWTALMLFVAAAALMWVATVAPGRFERIGRWPEALLLLLGAATTLASLSRQLPAQNVVLAATLIGVMSGALYLVNGLASVPLGPIVYHRENVGQFLIRPLPWPLPVLWVVVILNARGVARLALRPRRRDPNYGLWVIGATVALVVLFELSFQPYATHIKAYWTWGATKLPSNWYTTPWTNFLGCAVMSLLLLLFVTPALIDKSPVPRPPALHPLLVWEVLNALFFSATLQRHLWNAAALTSAQMIVVGSLSLAGAAAKRRTGANALA